ncbi:MAG: octaprenyl-diphosphate synthase [bacterium]|nr:MAG: octaprenyl-diphosphate synthase [bacterium]
MKIILFQSQSLKLSSKDLAFLKSFKLEFDNDFVKLIKDDKFLLTGVYAKKIALKVLSGGKRLRPILLYLAASMTGYNDKKKIKRLGFVIELIHIASLMHDDVMDNADMRRGKKTVSYENGNSIAILTGDYLYSLAYRIALEFEKPIPEIVSIAASHLAEGQMEETRLSGNFFLSFSDYIRIIYNKTAVMFECAIKIGSILGNNASDLRNLSRFGRYLGYSFQITDDILDYIGSSAMLGKPVLSDLAEGKATMPLIAARTCSEPQERSNMKRLWDKKEDIQKIESWVIKNNGIALAKSVCLSYIKKADSLLEDIKDCYEKELLIKIANRSIFREK